MFNLKKIQSDLLKSPVNEDSEGNRIRTLYLGTVFDLLPSGKYYTCFANSNVSEEEAEKDEEWMEEANKELESIGASLESGEGDPCDLFITQIEALNE